MNPAPKPGTLLHDDDGNTAIVVEEKDDLLECLIDLVQEAYGGDFSVTNPALVKAAEGLEIDHWYSCTKNWMNGEGYDPDEYPTFWSPDGDGKRSIYVIALPFSNYTLAEEAEEYEVQDG